MNRINVFPPLALWPIFFDSSVPSQPREDTGTGVWTPVLWGSILWGALGHRFRICPSVLHICKTLHTSPSREMLRSWYFYLLLSTFMEKKKTPVWSIQPLSNSSKYISKPGEGQTQQYKFIYTAYGCKSAKFLNYMGRCNWSVSN